MNHARKSIEKQRASIRNGRMVQEHGLSDDAKMFLEAVAVLDEVLDNKDGVSYDD